MPPKSNHYIDNKKFMEDLIAHKKAVNKAKKENTPKPGITNYIGQCFLDIANNLAKKPNFTNYTYKEEMVSDAVENCVMYATNFDPKKSTNPFAFFTQIVYYAFLRRIQKEKKQLFIKMRAFEQNDPTGKFRNWMSEEHKKYEDSTESPFYEFMIDDFAEREKTQAKKKKAKKKVATKAKDKKLKDLME
jgi:hypothetical protein